MKNIKRRLASVASTKKIMKAMNMVAASKLQKDKARLEATCPFFSAALRIIEPLRSINDSDSPFLTQRKVKNSAYLIIAADRGLCGSYNTNLANAAIEHMEGKNEKILMIGQRGYELFKRKGKNILRKYDDVINTVFFEEAQLIAADLVQMYSKGEADEVYIVYTDFVTAITYVPRISTLLPITEQMENPLETKCKPEPYVPTPPSVVTASMKYEPNLPEYLEQAVPFFLSATVYTALLEASTCEQAARMVSMDTSSTNADEITTTLTRTYNRIRQNAITQEISEVVGASQD
ncbi:MAG: ATP synthase F1 subunit gamma [Oscillospiraceae bacterium]|nr:ATP synthase F1 subunit gamma [Oscillospiraceae bacterium]